MCTNLKEVDVESLPNVTYHIFGNLKGPVTLIKKINFYTNSTFDATMKSIRNNYQDNLQGLGPLEGP